MNDNMNIVHIRLSMYLWYVFKWTDNVNKPVIIRRISKSKKYLFFVAEIIAWSNTSWLYKNDVLGNGV
jgi:hypothetical protein